MNMMTNNPMMDRYQKCIDASKRMRWTIEEVIQGRSFDTDNKFLPDGLTFASQMDFLSADEQRFVSQIQGRTYAQVFGVAERFVNAKVLELSHEHALDDQVALEALVRFSDEELKHQALFREVDALCEAAMPEGYVFAADPNDVASAVLSKSTWAVLMLTLHIELFTQSHYRESIDGDKTVSPLYRDVFKYHWREECQHAILDELELRAEDAMIADEERDVAVDEFIDLVCAVDGILQAQAPADAAYFAATCGRSVSPEEEQILSDMMLKAYRWTYILSGAEHRQFVKVVGELLTETQITRVMDALETLR